MTEELFKDIKYKLKHAEKIKNSRGVTISFELGSVAAGIQERFYRMLNIYRKYANMRDFKTERWQVSELMNAYHIIQGDYNEIRHEKSLYDDIVQRHESTTRRKQRTLPTNTIGRRRQGMTWKPNKRLT
ncbi:uncharacterized protein [Maniola hyperantus]|uniref:uncharacterized protein n=1 Tax=Aphantopus hyperantus TaxID=2795564 RepID=UPI003747E49B